MNWRPMRCALLLAALLPLTGMGQKTEGGAVLLRGGTVHPAVGPTLAVGSILVKDGKIAWIGTSAEEPDLPDGTKVIDCKGKVVTPGLIELHNHTLASDLHDVVYAVNPELRVVDNVKVDSPEGRIALAGGVTTTLTIPGSGSNMGGFGVVLKTFAKSPEAAVVAFPGALKIAQAGNPERQNGDLGHGRMGMNWLIRNVLEEGKVYHDRWTAFEEGKTTERPERILRYEPLRGLFRKEYPVLVHTQQFQVVQSTVRILCDELGLDVVIGHGTFDGYINASTLAKRGIPVANGPRQLWYDRREGRVLGLAAAWHWGGIPGDAIGVNTDAGVVPQEELAFQATTAIQLGLPWDAALKGLTIGAARMLKLEDRLGSLEVGKDADIVIWSGDPFDPRHTAVTVLVDGEVAYDAARDGQRF